MTARYLRPLNTLMSCCKPLKQNIQCHLLKLSLLPLPPCVFNGTSYGLDSRERTLVNTFTFLSCFALKYVIPHILLPINEIHIICRIIRLTSILKGHQAHLFNAKKKNPRFLTSHVHPFKCPLI